MRIRDLENLKGDNIKGRISILVSSMKSFLERKAKGGILPDGLFRSIKNIISTCRFVFASPIARSSLTKLINLTDSDEENVIAKVISETGFSRNTVLNFKNYIGTDRFYTNVYHIIENYIGLDALKSVIKDVTGEELMMDEETKTEEVTDEQPKAKHPKRQTKK